ncbi:ABC transporter ATP-binding protein [Sporosarcina ureilytica]|uniref:ABC transporter ATP-binding protein n=1 Tax=Sporosarcina ureilytica TaxID=298596 RepID=A0A1D8JCH8_9BACL|nr:ATP-binding cassette domain-containing protein [Sporosarcina ureilytica]AOV06418.1 ABC transporter ATP-binding protein [Sporosarcina ureilytica]
MAYLEVNDLKVHFPIKGGILGRTVDHVKAVDGVSLRIEKGMTYGLVGESGSGKSTTGRAIMGLNQITEGNIILNGKDVTNERGTRETFRKEVQMIFQDPYSSLNPRKRVYDILAEPLRNFQKLSKEEENKRIHELLKTVGLSPESIHKYPHQFSGGQRQRIGIARAVALQPKLIIADEPVSALDVSVQAQVLNFMQEIQKEYGLTYIFIGHDLGVIRHVCDRIGIMYKGRFVEEGNTDEIFNNPQHIYTKRLVSAIPDINPRNRQRQIDLRAQVKKEYEESYDKYFDEDGSVYPLQRISDTHLVALPRRGE